MESVSGEGQSPGKLAELRREDDHNSDDDDQNSDGMLLIVIFNSIQFNLIATKSYGIFLGS